MCKVTGRLTVFFEEPFWVGVFERYINGKLSVAKVTFGAEPKDNEVYQFVLGHYYGLQFSEALEDAAPKTKKNPKRVQRDARKQMQEVGIGTKSQQALKMQQEQNKQYRKEKSREQKQLDAERMYELKQQKKERKASWTLKIGVINAN